MAYTPPAGNAINFKFVNAGYSPPIGSAIHFVFGGSIPPPPPGNPALPTGLSAARREEDEAPPFLQRGFETIVAAPAATVLSYQRPLMPGEEDLWLPTIFRRRVFAPIPGPVVIRPYVQIFTA